MASYEERTQNRKRVVLTPAITRAFWSRRRAWQGAEVKLFIETRYLKDGTPLIIEIWEDGADESSKDDFVARLDGSHKVNNGRCVADYKIQWDPATLGGPLELEGDSFEFYFLVKVEKPPITHKSNLLYVDLHPLIPSA